MTRNDKIILSALSIFIGAALLAAVPFVYSALRVRSEPVASELLPVVEPGEAHDDVLLPPVEIPPVVEPMPIPTVPVSAVSSDDVTPSGKPPQFVVLAFDGSYDLSMWRETREFAKSSTAAGAPLHFTYFINAVYLMAPSIRDLYAPPGHPLGASAIGFGYSARDVPNRLEQMNLAAAEGNELGSHAVGHFTGAGWSEADWRSELTQFRDLIANVGTNNALMKEPVTRQSILIPEKMVGFRAPELGTSAGLWPVLKELGYRYDTSLSAKPDAWPKKLENGLWEFPLARIPYIDTKDKILSMDYNFYFKGSGAKDMALKGTPEWQALHDGMLTSYLNYFNGNYEGNRAPVFIGHHFSKWNDGAYWEALKDFASSVCGQPEVRCVTFSELADYLDAQALKTP